VNEVLSRSKVKGEPEHWNKSPELRARFQAREWKLIFTSLNVVEFFKGLGGKREMVESNGLGEIARIYLSHDVVGTEKFLLQAFTGTLSEVSKTAFE